jgi:hypothetical protein
MPDVGRPSKYTEAIGLEICERIAFGEPVRQICLLDHMPDERTIYRWLVVNADFRQQYSRAKEAQQDKFDEELLDIADDARNDWIERENERTGKTFISLNEEAVARARLRVSTRQWLMGKHKPKKYGDKVVLEHSGGTNNSLTILTEQRRAELREKKKMARIERHTVKPIESAQEPSPNGANGNGKNGHN